MDGRFRFILKTRRVCIRSSGGTLAMRTCRSVCAFLIVVAFVSILAVATIVMAVQAIHIAQDERWTGFDDIYSESVDDCDPLMLAACY